MSSDPVNSFTAQASFARRMRPLVEADDFAIFLDNYEATFSAAFPSAGVDPDIGVRFDRNSVCEKRGGHERARSPTLFSILLSIARLLVRRVWRERPHRLSIGSTRDAI